MDKLKFRRSGIQARVLALTMFFTLGASLVIAASNMHQMTAEWERTTILNAEYALQTAASAIRRDVDEIDDLAGWCAYNPGHAHLPADRATPPATRRCRCTRH